MEALALALPTLESDLEDANQWDMSDWQGIAERRVEAARAILAKRKQP